MSPLELCVAAAITAAATAGIAALARLAADPAESCWVRGVIEQLDAHGSYDDGLIRVCIGLDPDRPLYPLSLGWEIRVGDACTWTTDRVELHRRLHKHYRTSRARARSEAS